MIEIQQQRGHNQKPKESGVDIGAEVSCTVFDGCCKKGCIRKEYKEQARNKPKVKKQMESKSTQQVTKRITKSIRREHSK